MHHTNYEKLKQKLNEFLFPLPSFCKKKKKKKKKKESQQNTTAITVVVPLHMWKDFVF